MTMTQELQEKVILANLLAPVAYVDHMKSPIRDKLQNFFSMSFTQSQNKLECLSLASSALCNVGGYDNSLL